MKFTEGLCMLYMGPPAVLKMNSFYFEFYRQIYECKKANLWVCHPRLPHNYRHELWNIEFNSDEQKTRSQQSLACFNLIVCIKFVCF